VLKNYPRTMSLLGRGANGSPSSFEPCGTGLDGSDEQRLEGTKG
jgi:hypothetical protein